jgi:hypothetical protein
MKGRIVSLNSGTHDRGDLAAAYRFVADYLYRDLDLGRFAYAAWDHINANYFGGRLPETFILWDLTDHGNALGWCRSQRDGPPIIKLHPALVMPAAEEPWGIVRAHLGYVYAYDVLLHECIHASVEYLLGGCDGIPGWKSYWSCHNNPLWIAEVNRIAPLLGYQGDAFTMKRPRRVPIPGETTKTGKPATRTVRRQDGNAPDFEHFPHSLPGREALYIAKVLPFDFRPHPRLCVAELEDTGATDG